MLKGTFGIILFSFSFPPQGPTDCPSNLVLTRWSSNEVVLRPKASVCNLFPHSGKQFHTYWLCFTYMGFRRSRFAEKKYLVLVKKLIILPKIISESFLKPVNNGTLIAQTTNISFLLIGITYILQERAEK